MKRKRPNTLEADAAPRPLPSLVDHHKQLRAWLISEGATGLGTLKCHVSDKGGIGTFTTVRILPGSVIAQIPQSCVLTATKALRSEFGRTCKKALESYSEATDEFVMMLWMSDGRRNPEHPFHHYLASLSEISMATPITWPSALVEGPSKLGGTNVGKAIKDHKLLVGTTYLKLLNVIRSLHPHLFRSDFQEEDMMWAHECYLSRRFPSRLCPSEEEESSSSLPSSSSLSSSSSSSSLSNAGPNIGPPLASTFSPLNEKLGVMLPFLDLTNHQQATKIHFHATDSQVLFTCNDDAKGFFTDAEVFNNYGNKSNDGLLMAYGFCSFNNPFDSYGLKLMQRMSATSEPIVVGMFWIFRSDNPGVEDGSVNQIPVALWRALADPERYIESEKLKEHEEENETALSIEYDDIEILLQTLRAHLMPFTATQQADTASASREMVLENEYFVSCYRDGQRRVLEDVIAVLTSILASS